MTAADQTLTDQMHVMGRRARAAARALALATAQTRTDAIRAMGQAIRADAHAILEANAVDLKVARARGTSEALLDRLALDPARVEALAAAIEAIADIPDPLGKVTEHWTRPNGLDISRVRTPIGVLAIIYESRPNVTADAAALALRSGNAAILRGGSESFATNQAIGRAVATGLFAAGLDPATIQLVPTTDRDAVGLILTGLEGDIDLVIPRGGRSLVERVQKDARVAVLGHLEGVNHVYVHASADAEMALAVVLNAKMRRVSVCGAAETLLVDRGAAVRLLPVLARALTEAGCVLRGDPATREIWPRAEAATDADWSTEYLDAILSVRIVANMDEALSHIARYGSGHTEAIVAEGPHAVERFLNEVDAAIVIANASTQFADGGEFGFGAEIGISTDRLHARGPVGAEQLTSFKYQVRGTGQVRP